MPCSVGPCLPAVPGLRGQMVMGSGRPICVPSQGAPMPGRAALPREMQPRASPGLLRLSASLARPVAAPTLHPAFSLARTPESQQPPWPRRDGPEPGQCFWIPGKFSHLAPGSDRARGDSMVLGAAAGSRGLQEVRLTPCSSPETTTETRPRGAAAPGAQTTGAWSPHRAEGKGSWRALTPGCWRPQWRPPPSLR